MKFGNFEIEYIISEYDNIVLIDGPLQGQEMQIEKGRNTIEIVSPIDNYANNYGAEKIIRPPMIYTYIRMISIKNAFIYSDRRSL